MRENTLLETRERLDSKLVSLFVSTGYRVHVHGLLYCEYRLRELVHGHGCCIVFDWDALESCIYWSVDLA